VLRIGWTCLAKLPINGHPRQSRMPSAGYTNHEPGPLRREPGIAKVIASVLIGAAMGKPAGSRSERLMTDRHFGGGTLSLR
jgi:hypothetical protein